jgi:dihydrofolate synthase/folylpolyglutamate synthase
MKRRLAGFTAHCDSVQPGLERTELLLAHLGHPEAGLQCIHVAGTNGKGSVAAMVASALSECGYRTGLYISLTLKTSGRGSCSTVARFRKRI